MNIVIENRKGSYNEGQEVNGVTAHMTSNIYDHRYITITNFDGQGETYHQLDEPKILISNGRSRMQFSSVDELIDEINNTDAPEEEPMTYHVVSGDETLIERISGSYAEIGLLVAEHFGEKYFGCSIIQNDPLTRKQILNGWGRNFAAIAVKDYYEGEDPVSAAVRTMVNHTRSKNGFYRTEENRDETSYIFDTPIK